MTDTPQLGSRGIYGADREQSLPHGIFDGDNRILIPVPIPLLDAEYAVAELKRALERGAKFVDLQPGPAYGNRSPFDPYFYPFRSESASCWPPAPSARSVLAQSGEAGQVRELVGQAEHVRVGQLLRQLG